VREVSAGHPTGRFVPVRVRALVKSTKVGTRMVERLVPDPKAAPADAAGVARAGRKCPAPDLLDPKKP
jgi:hypothetical protein